MAAMVMAFLFGLVGGDPATLVDKHYVRITSEADKPDPSRMITGSKGLRGFPYGEARYGWRIDKGNARGRAVYARVRQLLGEPMSIDWHDEPRQGYMWRDRGHAGRGMLIVVNERAQSVHLLEWIESDKGRVGRIGMEAENEIYRWFDWLTTPPEEHD